MTVTMSPADCTDANLKESQRPYHEQYFRSSEIAGFKISARSPPHVHHSTSRLSRPERRISKSIELLKGRSYS